MSKSWAVSQRQSYIAGRLLAVGHINRSDLVGHFGISTPQASADLATFQHENPRVMAYNGSTKRYEMNTEDAFFRGTSHCPICMRDTPHEHRMEGRWIGVDFDGTLAIDRFGRTDPYELGEPIVEMVSRVRRWVAAGYEVRIFTARMSSFSRTTGQQRNVKHMRTLISEWCLRHIGAGLSCTNEKDGAMEVLWDDRAVRVVRDTGLPAEFCNVGHSSPDPRPAEPR